MIGWLWLLGVALAGSRDPLPALPVERPLAVPRGWTLLGLDAVRGPASDRGEAALRYGVLPRVELSLSAGLARRTDTVRLGPPALGARFRVLRREPSNSSVVVDLSWRDGPGIGVVAARRAGPVLGTVAVVGDWRSAPALRTSMTALLQIGPLAPWGALVWGWPRGISARAGLVAQLSRGLALQGAIAPHGTTLAVEIAF